MGTWTLGAGLKLIFSRNSPTGLYVAVLIVEGAGIGFVLQPGMPPLSYLEFDPQLISHCSSCCSTGTI